MAPYPHDRHFQALVELAASAGQILDSYSSTDSASLVHVADPVSAATSGCLLKTLPGRLLSSGARTATEINPANAPVLGALSSSAQNFREIANPQALTVLTSKYWGPTPRALTVSFAEPAPAELRARIIGHMNAWGLRICVSFRQTSGAGQVRISRAGNGYWSYLGTDVLHVPLSRQTMNLAGFTMSTPESEYRRVVRHETGHTLGFPHEHMRKALVGRIDPQKAYSYFARTQGWDRRMVDEQVLTSLDDRSIMGTPADQTSIMCYQLPGSITRDGLPIRGGTDINQTDYTFAAKLYPRQQSPTVRDRTMQDQTMQDQTIPSDGDSEWLEGQWDQSEDVEVALPL